VLSSGTRLSKVVKPPTVRIVSTFVHEMQVLRDTTGTASIAISKILLALQPQLSPRYFWHSRCPTSLPCSASLGTLDEQYSVNCL